MSILLFNYAPALLALLVFLAAVYIFYTFVNTSAVDEKAGRKLWKRMAGLVLVAILLKIFVPAFNNSIIPEANVPRLPVPEFEQRDDLVVEDRLKRPAKTEEERQRDFDKMVDWRDKSPKKE